MPKTANYSLNLRRLFAANACLGEPHHQFLALYGYTENAAKSARLAGLVLEREPPSSSAYVYMLLDGDGGKILYVGKGTRDRMLHHNAEARKGSARYATAKHATLRKMISQGRPSQPVVFVSGLSDHEALVLEKSLIAWIGTINLLNSSKGRRSPFETARAEVKAMLDDVMPFDTWMASGKRTDEHVALYHRFMTELHKMIAELEAQTFADKVRIIYEETGPRIELSFRGAKAKLKTTK